ncbi:MAG: SPOR domain-containing protein [Spirochaetes bacterium]|nr:SPOR domain-containing protein [Spirochaetota bacterium]
MEQYNEPHRKISEKNVYLLHLDTPRIILISLAAVGIVIATFLLGMNFAREDGTQVASITGTDPILNKQGDMSLINPEIPEAPMGVDSQDPTAMKDTIVQTPQKDITQDPISPGKVQAAEVITPENISEAHRQASVDKERRHEKAAAAPERQHRDVARNRTKNRTRENRKSERSRVVEVSSPNEPGRSRNRSGFAIQVASYDSRSRASSEVSRLKRQRYDAFIDRTTVNGRPYYRVRIGPIRSHNAAERVLQDIQESHRYSESYMIRQ